MMTYATNQFAANSVAMKNPANIKRVLSIFRRVATVVMAAGLSMAGAQTLSTTTIQDTIYRADGTVGERDPDCKLASFHDGGKYRGCRGQHDS